MALSDALKELEKVSKTSKVAALVKGTTKPKPKVVPPIMSKSTPIKAQEIEGFKPVEKQAVSTLPILDKKKTTVPAYGTKGYMKTAQGTNINPVVNPYAVGITEVVTGKTAEFLPGFKEAQKQAAEQFPKSYGAGKILGYAGPTGLAAGATKGLVGAATKNLSSKLAKKVVEGAIIGTAAEATQIVKPLVKKEITPEQAGKQLTTGLAYGAGIDVGLYGLGKIAKPILSKIKSGIALSQAEKISAAKQMNVPIEDVDTVIQRELGLPKETTAQDFMRQQEQVAKDIELDQYYKSFEKDGELVRPLVSETPIRAEETSLVRPLVEEPTLQALESSTSLVKPLVEQEPTRTIKSIASEVEQPKSVSDKLIIPTGQDTRVAKVLTELPKKRGIPFTEKAAKVYQELITSDLPLERIGRKNDKVTNLTNTLRKVGGSVDYNIETALTDIEGNVVGKSLSDVFKDVPKVDKEDLFKYALHKHNIARYEQGKPVYGDTVDVAKSQSELARLSANPQLEAKSKEMTDYMNGLMDNWALKSGLVDEDTLKQLRELYPNYVPTYRDKESAKQIVGGAKGNVSNVIKKAEGGSSDILPLDQQMAMLTNKIVRASRKNELYNSLFDTFESNPEFTERWFKPISKEKPDITEGIDGIADTFEEPIKKVGDTYELNFFRNGEKVKAQISKDLYDAIKPLSEATGIENMAAIVKKYGTNPFKALITTYNPIFVARNIMRDIPTAFIYSNDAIEWSKQMPIAFKEIVSNGKAWNEYRALGGTRSGIFSYDKPTNIKFKSGKGNLIQAGAKGVLNGVETLNNVTETLPRFAEYLATVKKGGGTYESKLEGIMRASEITTDFSRSGKTGKTVDAFVPYLNPSLQGIDKFFRQVKNKPLETALKGGTMITVPTVILDQMNKNNRDYQELNERERNQSYLIPDGNGKFIRIPKSREVGVVFSSLFDWIARRSRGEDVTMSEITSTIKENFTPVNMVENNLFAPMYKAMQQIKDPERDVKNYAGLSIVPSALKKFEPKEQYDAYTSEVGKQLGQIIGISPKVVDYLIKSYSGILGQTLMPKTTASQRSVLESAFVTDPAFKSGNVNKFYDELDKQTKELAKQKREDEDKVDRTLKLRVKDLNAVSRDLSDLRKEQKEIDTGNLSAEEKKRKIREIQLEMNRITRESLLKGGK